MHFVHMCALWHLNTLYIRVWHFTTICAIYTFQVTSWITCKVCQVLPKLHKLGPTSNYKRFKWVPIYIWVHTFTTICAIYTFQVTTCISSENLKLQAICTKCKNAFQSAFQKVSKKCKMQFVQKVSKMYKCQSVKCVLNSHVIHDVKCAHFIYKSVQKSHMCISYMSKVSKAFETHVIHDVKWHVRTYVQSAFQSAF